MANAFLSRHRRRFELKSARGAAGWSVAGGGDGGGWGGRRRGGGDQRRLRSSSSESSVMTLVSKEVEGGVGRVELHQSRSCVIAHQMEVSWRRVAMFQQQEDKEGMMGWTGEGQRTTCEMLQGIFHLTCLLFLAMLSSINTLMSQNA